MSKLQIIFRRSLSHYVQYKIYPYLTLPGSVEIDESKVSNKKFDSMKGGGCHIRWIFGMVCRKTKLCIIYSI